MNYYTVDARLIESTVRAELLATNAKNLDELRRAQAVLLTVSHKLTLRDAAKVIGRSTSWVAHARRAFIENGVASKSHDHGGRRNQIMSEEEEASFMEEACERFMRLQQTWPPIAERAERQVHRVVRKMLEERTGREIPNSTAFALMSRVGKRKFKDYKAREWEGHAYDLVRS